MDIFCERYDRITHFSPGLICHLAILNSSDKYFDKYYQFMNPSVDNVFGKLTETILAIYCKSPHIMKVLRKNHGWKFY